MRVPSAIVCIAAASLLPLLAGCFDRALEPEPVPLDRVNCARCGMMVSEEGDSAQWVAAGEEPRFYDDIGCLAAFAWFFFVLSTTPPPSRWRDGWPAEPGRACCSCRSSAIRPTSSGFSCFRYPARRTFSARPASHGCGCLEEA